MGTRKIILMVLPVACLSSTAMAISYASGVLQSGGNLSFTLNQAADDVTIVLDGVPTSLGALGKGTHTVPDGGATAFSIEVSSSTPTGWTQISSDDTSTSFYLPLGVSVNKNALSPHFGNIYVSESQGGTTAFGRTTTSGIYMLTADAADAGWADGGRDWAAAGSSAPFKSTIGPDDHLYCADFSNDLVFEFSADMSSASALIDATNKTAGQYTESIHVEGTQAGGDREIYLVNSHYLDGRRGLIKYDLGGNAAATTGDTGTQYIGPDYFAYYPRDVARDSAGNWYMNQYRYEPGQAPPIAKFLDGAPPINTAEWEVDDSLIGTGVGAYGIDVFEQSGLVAFGSYYTGDVWLFDMDTGALVDSFDAGNRIREVAFDAVGNLYTVDNVTEWLRIWSPGGDWLATTGSDGTLLVVPEPTSLSVPLDILPSDCPNKLTVNLKSKGKARLPIAMLGTADFDVSQIDFDSLSIDGMLFPVRTPEIKDVTTPVTDGDECDCQVAEGDGIDDLMLHFSKRDLILALGLDLMDSGAVVPITVTGSLLDGTPFEATDCVTLMARE